MKKTDTSYWVAFLFLVFILPVSGLAREHYPKVQIERKLEQGKEEISLFCLAGRKAKGNEDCRVRLKFNGELLAERALSVKDARMLVAKYFGSLSPKDGIREPRNNPLLSWSVEYNGQKHHGSAAVSHPKDKRHLALFSLEWELSNALTP